MRILHVLTAFPRSTDDVIVPWLVELLKHLRAAGHEVEVLTSAYKGGGNREFAGIPVHRFRYFPARWEDLTHDEAAPDRMRHSWRYRIMPVFYVVCGAWAAWRLGAAATLRRGARALAGAPCAVRLADPARLRRTAAVLVVRRRAAVGERLPALAAAVRPVGAETSDQVVAISSHTAREIASGLRRSSRASSPTRSGSPPPARPRRGRRRATGSACCSSVGWSSAKGCAT